MISNNPRKSSSKQKIINLIFLFTVFLVATIYFIILPSLKSIKELDTAILNEKIDSQKKYQTEKNAIELGKKIKKIESSVDNLDDVFINKNRELEFITTLENIANKNNVTQKINLATPEEPNTSTKNSKNKNIATTSKNTIQSSPLSMTISGNYKNIISYLLEINSLDYYINFEKMDFYKAISNTSLTEDNRQKNNSVNLNITAKTYWK